MNHIERSLSRLLDLARRAPAGDEVLAAPPGFATRVAAQWVGGRYAGTNGSIWEWLAMRGLAVACALSIMAAFASWSLVKPSEHDELVALADPLTSEVLPP
jgi:hypothetical protein